MDIADLEKDGTSHVADGLQTAGHLNLFLLLEVGAQLTGGGGHFVTRTVRINAQFTQLRELLAANGNQLSFSGLGGRGGSLRGGGCGSIFTHRAKA